MIDIQYINLLLHKKYYELYGKSLLKFNICGYDNILPLELCSINDSNIQDRENILIYEYQIMFYYQQFFNGVPIIIMSESLHVGENLDDSLVLESRRGITVFKNYKVINNIILINEKYLLFIDGDDYYICLDSTNDNTKQRLLNGYIKNMKRYFSKNKTGKYFFIHKDMRDRYPNK